MINNIIKETFRFRLLAVMVTLLLILEAVTTGLFPYSRGYLYEVLTTQTGLLWISIGAFFLNQFIFEILQAVKKYLILKLSLKARKSRMSEVVGEPIVIKDHVPQRLQEDIKLSYLMRLTVISEYFIAILILIQLTIVNLSEPLLILGSFTYAAISVWIAIKFNPKLKHAEISEQRAEAGFREGLAETISPTGVIGANKASLMAGLLRMQYALFTKTQLAVLAVLPYVVLGPMVFAGSLSMGDLVQHSTTFSLIVVNAALLINFYTVWVKGTASEIRVKELTEGVLEENKQERGSP